MSLTLDQSNSKPQPSNDPINSWWTKSSPGLQIFLFMKLFHLQIYFTIRNKRLFSILNMIHLFKKH